MKLVFNFNTGELYIFKNQHVKAKSCLGWRALETEIIARLGLRAPSFMERIYRVAGNCRGGMAAFRAMDDQPQWNLSLKGCIRSNASSGNMLFAGAQEGTIYAYELSQE